MILIPVVIAFAVLTVLYLIISVWSRSVRRENLEEEWDEEIRQGDRDAFIEEGLKEYDRSFRKKLILGVYIVPMVLMLALVYVINFM